MRLRQDLRSATAKAPASVGNIAVGFDVLGHALAKPFDQVTVIRENEGEGIRMGIIVCDDCSLPEAVAQNTAGAAVAEMVRRFGIAAGLRIDLHKSIPVARGLGGSAASAVAAVVALNELLETPLSTKELYRFALAGESVASNSWQGDNVAASLLGGLTVAPPELAPPMNLPAPSVYCTLAVPDTEVRTEDARAAVPSQLSRELVIAQLGHTASFITACVRDDHEAIRRHLRDLLIEPYRAPLMPAFHSVQRAAMDAGALGASLSGSGSSVFAWFSDQAQAEAACDPMCSAFAQSGLQSNAFVSPISPAGAAIVDSVSI